ncbi:hypothetical protein Tco_0325988 [Tanacetum coccineum]
MSDVITAAYTGRHHHPGRNPPPCRTSPPPRRMSPPPRQMSPNSGRNPPPCQTSPPPRRTSPTVPLPEFCGRNRLFGILWKQQTCRNFVDAAAAAASLLTQ